jgi:hypothetical protein
VEGQDGSHLNRMWGDLICGKAFIMIGGMVAMGGAILPPGSSGGERERNMPQ